MIPRHQRYLFWILAAGILLAVLVLLRGCKQAHDRLATPEDGTPIAAPTSAREETFNLLLANDADGALHLDTRRFALPAEPTTRARALLEHLIAEYSLPNSRHPLPSGAAIDDIFLLTLPLSSAADPLAATSRHRSTYTPPPFDPLLNASGQLAVINLRSSFVENHPSGIEVEDLTLRSLIGTLHTNLPDLTAVRFLVDGRPRETLAGHADLTRTYATTGTDLTQTTSP